MMTLVVGILVCIAKKKKKINLNLFYVRLSC